METKRLKYIDFVKGISITLVVLGHIISSQSKIGIWIYSFHIPLFFIISGYLFGYKNEWKDKSIKENIKSIMTKILYPYFTFSLISIVFVFLKDVINNESETNEYILSTLRIEGYGPMWFMTALLIGEIIFVIINRIKNKNKTYITYFIIFIFTLLLTSVINYIRDTSIIIINQNFTDILLYCFNILNRACIGTIFIYVGYILYNLLNNFKYDRTLFLVISIFIVIINIFLSQINPNIDLRVSQLNNIFIYYVLAIGTSASIILLAKEFLLHNKVIEFYGKNSLIVMATHWNLQILYIVRKIVNLEGDIQKVIVFVFVMIIEAILILVINKYFPFLLKYENRRRIERNEKSGN